MEVRSYVVLGVRVCVRVRARVCVFQLSFLSPFFPLPTALPFILL